MSNDVIDAFDDVICVVDSEAQDRDKLSKLLDLWEEQKYFQNKIINGIRKPENTFNEYQVTAGY